MIKSSKQSGSVVAIIIVLVVVGLIGFLGWRLYEASQPPAPATPQANNTEPECDNQKLIKAADYADWKTYTNTKYGYSFMYPASATLVESPGDGPFVPATATSGGVHVNYAGQAKFSFSIQAGAGLASFTKEAVLDTFAEPPSSVAATKVDCNQAFMADFAGIPKVVSDFYFVKTGNERTWSITVSKTNEISKKIFSSLALPE